MHPKQTIELPIINKNSHIEPGQYSLLLKDRLSRTEFNGRVTKINAVVDKNNCSNIWKVLFILVIPSLLGIGIFFMTMMKILPIPVGAGIGIWFGIIAAGLIVLWVKIAGSSSKIKGVIDEFNEMDKSKNIKWRLTARTLNGNEVAYSEIFSTSGNEHYDRRPGHTNIVAIDILPLVGMTDTVDDNVPLDFKQGANMRDVKIAFPEPTWSNDIIV